MINYTTILKWLKDNPAYVFIILASIFGLLFVIRLAPLNGTDEFTHFPHAYQVSQGTYWEQRLPGDQFGGNLPQNINSMINDYRNLSRISPGPSYQQTKNQLNAKYGSLTNPGNKKVSANFTSTIIYPPWAYLPSIVGIWLARILDLPLIWYVYLARICCLIAWLVLGFLAIRLIPAGKWFLVALALLPSSLTQAATISSDGLLMGLCWLLIALVLGISSKRIKPTWPRLIAISLIATYAALIKDGYFLIGLLPLAIPSSVFVKKISGQIWQGLTAAVVVVTSALFTLRTVHAVDGVVLTPTYGVYMNTKQQIAYMTQHLFKFGLNVLTEPFTKTFDTTYEGLVGIITNRLIYLAIPMMFLLYFSLYYGFKHIKRVELLAQTKRRFLIVSLSIFILSYFLLASAFYIGNTQVGATYVNGYYGRYFLPLIPLLAILPMVLVKKEKNTQVFYPQVILAIGLLGLIATILSLQ